MLATDNGIFKVTNQGGRWTRQFRFGPSVNANGTEIGPMLSPSGHSLLFSRDAGGGQSGELFVARLAGNETWPSASHGRCGS